MYVNVSVRDWFPDDNYTFYPPRWHRLYTPRKFKGNPKAEVINFNFKVTDTITFIVRQIMHVTYMEKNNGHKSC